MDRCPTGPETAREARQCWVRGWCPAGGGVGRRISRNLQVLQESQKSAGAAGVTSRPRRSRTIRWGRVARAGRGRKKARRRRACLGVRTLVYRLKGNFFQILVALAVQCVASVSDYLRHFCALRIPPTDRRPRHPLYDRRLTQCGLRLLLAVHNYLPCGYRNG